MFIINLTRAEKVSFSPAEIPYLPSFVDLSPQALYLQDTIRVPASVTLQISEQDSLQNHVRLNLPDEEQATLNLPAREQDTLEVAVDDTLHVPVPDSFDEDADNQSVANEQDTLQVIPSGSLPDTSGSIWDRIDARDRAIETTPSEAAVEPVQAESLPDDEAGVPVTSLSDDKPSWHDASHFLDTSTNNIFWEGHVFPVTDNRNDNLADSLPVFIEHSGSSLNNTSRSYKSYMDSGTDDYVLENLQYSTVWIPWLVILSFLLLTWIKLVYVQFLTPVILSAFKYKEAFKLYSNRNAPTKNTFLILHLIFAINGGLFLFFITGHFEFDLPDIRPPLLFLSASLTLIIIFAIRSAAMSVISFIFDRRKLFAEYKYNISLYTKIFGILLLPVILGLLYADQNVHVTLIYSGLVMGAVFYLLQLFRGLEIIVKKEFSVFYLILYLCAFEILPIFILIRLIETFLI